MEGKLAGKVAVVTGASSGIGIETVRALVATGATIYAPCRDLDKAKLALDSVINSKKIILIRMDLSSLESVRNAAKSILEKTGKVNILVNNAAIMAVPDLQLTKDGFEIQFATNHLAHFLLFQLLKPALLAASSPEYRSRVVIVSSAAHRVYSINASDNYSFQSGGYHPFLAYAQSKTANIYMASEIERRYGAKGLHAISLHPGVIDSGLSRYLPSDVVNMLRSDPELLRLARSPEQGAATTLWAIIAPELEDRGGRYMIDCAEAERGEDDGSDRALTYVSHTYSPDDEARLWEDSNHMVGCAGDE
jgi:NAD(P)-dependent dehydrogenase (short-subunit alcohol dehydrogenase family)